jgi:hypothetical protein
VYARNHLGPSASANPTAATPSITLLRNRFSMPGAQGNWSQNMWFSWDLANVHFIAYSSEVSLRHESTQ